MVTVRERYAPVGRADRCAAARILQWSRRVIDQQIAEYEIQTAVDSSSYWQGAGTAFTDYTDLATGIGESERDALDDALEQLAMSGWDVTGDVRDALDAHRDLTSTVEDVHLDCEPCTVCVGCVDGHGGDDGDGDYSLEDCHEHSENCEVQYFVTVRVR